MMEMSSKREASMDICKGICILMVILGHQFEKLGIHKELQYIQTFHMPMFFLIAGYFISDNISCKKFAGKRAKRLLVPYYVSVLIVIPLSFWLVPNFDIHDWVWRIFNASGHGEQDRWIWYIGRPAQIGMLWYLPALFWSSITVKSICKDEFSGLEAIMISSIAIGTTTIFGWIPFSIPDGLGAVMWVWLGYYLKKNEMLPDLMRFLHSPWIGAVILIWILSARYGYTRLYANNYQLGIVDIIGAVTGSMVVISICDFIALRMVVLKNVLSWIGVNSLLIYCLHFLEHNVRPVSKELMEAGMKGNTKIALVSWMIILVIACLGTLVLTRIPLVKKIFE